MRGSWATIVLLLGCRAPTSEEAAVSGDMSKRAAGGAAVEDVPEDMSKRAPGASGPEAVPEDMSQAAAEVGARGAGRQADPKDMAGAEAAPEDMAGGAAKGAPEDLAGRGEAVPEDMQAAAGPPRFHVALKMACGVLELHRLAAGGIAVSCFDELAGAAGGVATLTRDLRWKSFSSEEYARYPKFGGRWPDALLVTYEAATSRTTAGSSTAERVGGAWQALRMAAPAGLAAFYDEFAGTTDGRVLALRVHRPADGYPMTLKGGRKAKVPAKYRPHRLGDYELDWFGAAALDLVVGEGPPPPPPKNAVVLGIEVAAAGDVLLYTKRGILHAPAGATHWRPLPEPPGAPASVAVGEDGRIEAVACDGDRTTIHRWDADGWVAAERVAGCAHAVTVAADGVLWGRKDKDIVRASVGASAWEAVPVHPEGFEAPISDIEELVVRGDAAWVRAQIRVRDGEDEDDESFVDVVLTTLAGGQAIEL